MDLQKVGHHGLDESGSRQGQVTGSCECGDEPSDFIGEFLEKLRTFLGSQEGRCCMELVI